MRAEKSEYDQVMSTKVEIQDKKLLADLRVLIRFTEVYCEGEHPQAERQVVEMQTHDLQAIAGKEVKLCPVCTRLLMHAVVKRTRCPMDPKPACKHCPKHCYAPEYRQQMRKVMAYSGRKLVMRGRLDYLLHLLF